MVLDLRDVTLLFLTSVLLGVLFSVVPAIKASRVLPVEALRDV